MNLQPLKLAIIATFVTLMSTNTFAEDVGVTWVGKSGMSNRVLQGFESRLQEIAPSIKLEYKKELKSMADLPPVIAAFEKTKKAIVVLRSNGAKFLSKNPTKLPTFIGGVNHPKALGVVQNLNKPEGNITGVTYALPIATQFETIQAILPNLQNVLLLTEAGHPSGDIDRKNTKEISEALGLKLTSVAISSPSDAVKAASSNAGKVDVIILGNQAKVFDSAKMIINAAGNTPVFSYSAKPVKDGALGGFAADDVKLGSMLAESVVEIIINGKSISQVPVKFDDEPTFSVNVTTAEKLEIEIPFEILNVAVVIE